MFKNKCKKEDSPDKEVDKLDPRPFKTYKEIVKEYKIKEKAKQDFRKIQAKITIEKLHKWRKENGMDFKDDYFYEDL